MLFVPEREAVGRLLRTRSLRGFLFGFLKNHMVGQKALLHNPRLPRVVNISFIEKTCFYRCTFCPYSLEDVREAHRERSEMSWETLRRLVAACPNDPFYSFDISAIGETLEFAPLAEYIAYMKAEKPLVNTVVSTNGLLLDEGWARRLIESGLDNLQVSLFAQNPDDYERLCGSRHYGRVCENVETFMRIRREMGRAKPHVQAFILGAEEFADRVPRFLERWSGVVDKAFVRPLYNAGMNATGLTPSHAVSQMRYPCVMPWYSTSITSTGGVAACYFFGFYPDLGKVGNINERPVSEIWRGEALDAFRRLHLEGRWDEHPICRKCDLGDAYTDIWDRSNGAFRFRRRLSDWFTKVSRDYRGR